MSKRGKRKKNFNQEIDEELDGYVSPLTNSKKSSFFSKTLIDNSDIILSEKQQEIYKGIRNNTLTIIQGPAGTSKTFIACYTALSLLADKKINRIVITKPIQESGEALGFLKGTLAEKTMPYEQSYYSTFQKIIPVEVLENLKLNGLIKFEPLAYMRGSTYDNCLMMLDECQNSTFEQLMLWITRLGRDTKAIMMGDVSQYDIKKKDMKFLDFINLMDGVSNLFSFKFEKEDIVRNKFLIEIVDRYEKHKYENEQKNLNKK